MNPEADLYNALDELCGGVAAFIAHQSEISADFARGGTSFVALAMPSGKVIVAYLSEVNGDLVPETQREIMVDPVAQRARAVVDATMLGRLDVDGDADATSAAVETVRQAVRRFQSGAMHNVETGTA